jgi:hypothetical protein
LDGALDPGGDDHGSCLAAYLAEPDHLLVEMVDHDLGFGPDRVIVGHKPPIGVRDVDQAVVSLDTQPLQRRPVTDPAWTETYARLPSPLLAIRLPARNATRVMSLKWQQFFSEWAHGGQERGGGGVEECDHAQ